MTSSVTSVNSNSDPGHSKINSIQSNVNLSLLMYPLIDKDYQNEGSIQWSPKIACTTVASKMLKAP